MADLDRHVEWLQRDLDVGFEKIFLHDVTTEQAGFIDDFGEEVVTELE